jgi:cytochrome b561
MVLRFIVRVRTSRPTAAWNANPTLSRLEQASHLAFYGLVVLLAATGLATAILAGLNRIVFARTGEPLPADLTSYPSFVAHAFLAAAVAGLIVLHVAAALRHQLVLKDRLLDRMVFARRTRSKAGESNRPAA